MPGSEPIINSGPSTDIHRLEHTLTACVIKVWFVGDPNLSFVPVVPLLRENQLDICTLDEGRKKCYRFQIDLNNVDTVDIRIGL